MVRVCGIDLETSGLDFEKDRIVELAYVIKDVGNPRPISMRSYYIYEPCYGEEPSPPEVVDIHGIPNEWLRKWGRPLDSVVSVLGSALRDFDVDFIVAHNGENFDRPFLLRQMELLCGPYTASTERVESTPWLDTKADIEYPPRFKSTALTSVAAELGFLNPFPHAALMDVCTMLKVLDQFNFDAVVTRSKTPWVTVRAVVTYDNREEAKKRRYSWEKLGEETYPKSWVKRIKENEVERETAEAPFRVVQIA